MQLDWTVKYPGGHDKDPGYRANRIIHNGRMYICHSDPDGSHARMFSSKAWYPATNIGPKLNFRQLSAKQQTKIAPAFSAFLMDYFAKYADAA